MCNKFIRLFYVLFFIIINSACVTKLTQQQQIDKKLHQMVEDRKDGGKDIAYDALWNAYLESTQTEDTGLSHSLFLAVMEELSEGKKNCSQINWDEIVSLNYWSIQPHLEAANCYTQLNNSKSADYHEGFVAFILEGVFNSGTGKHYYDAYEAGNWGDVEDILKLAGYKTIDTYFEFKAAKQGIYYVVIAEDEETGKQQNIYFDNIRFIRSALGYRGRFGDEAEPLGQVVIKEMANQQSNAAIALGDMLAAEKNYDDASTWYLKASLHESPVAYMKLSQLCLNGLISDYNDGACLEFVTKSAELEYAQAYVLLSALYNEGVWVKKDKELSDTFLNAASEKLGKGKANAELAKLYHLKAFGKNLDESNRWLIKAKKERFIDDALVEFYRNLAFVDKTNETKSIDSENTLVNIADEGNVLAQFYVGSRYLIDGSSGKDDKLANKGLEYLKRSASQGLPQAVYVLGNAYKHGVGVIKDNKEAIYFFKIAGEDWLPSAQYEVASEFKSKSERILTTLTTKRGTINAIMLSSNPSLDKKNAFIWMRSAAMQGDVDAILSLGYYHEKGVGTKIDFKRAASLYKIASDAGNAQAAFNYGYLLENGDGVEVDFVEAKKYYHLADDRGNSGGANQIGLLYENGHGVALNLNEAIKWFTKAAEKNDMYALYNLGRFYENGLGVESDNSRALEFYKKAAEKGHDASKEKVAVLEK